MTSKQKGFTLLETLIYITLTALIVTAVFATTYQLILNASEINTKNAIEEEGNFVLQKIEWALTGASNITIPAQNSTSTVLSVEKYNFSNNPIIFDQSGNQARIKIGTNPPLFLNNNSVLVENLLFEHLLPYSTSSIATVRTSFTMNGNQFESTTYLKK